jgi:hypothetical protein
MEHDERADEETEKAAQEAGAIGGDTGVAEGDPERAPVEEAGGGVAEGFEQAEADLEDRATNPRGPSPLAHAGEADETAQAVEGGDYGEGDALGSSARHEEDRED